MNSIVVLTGFAKRRFQKQTKGAFTFYAQVPGGQISPSEKYKNLSHPKLLQILFAMGILMKSQERNWGVPVAIWELWPCQYWPDRGSPDTHLTGINHQNKPWDDLGMPIHSQFVNIFHQ